MLEVEHSVTAMSKCFVSKRKIVIEGRDNPRRSIPGAGSSDSRPCG